MHYPAGSYGMYDQTKVHIYFYPEPVTAFREVLASPIISNWAFTINANTVDTVYGDYGPTPVTLTFMSVFPHMHLLGKAIQSYAVTPALDTIPFVRINQWDFHWQEFYFFKYMQKVPGGSTIHGRGIYDNTLANHHNPNDPPINVSAGFNTTDEMFLIYYHFMIYQAGDEYINVDSLNNIYLSQDNTNNSLPITSSFNVFPNPFKDHVSITYQLINSAFVSVAIYDTQGRYIRTITHGLQDAGEQNLIWDGKNEAGLEVGSGLYYYSALVNGKPINGSIILMR